MDDQPIDELRMLRVRAYGPDPDIHHDPSALARLQDLERLARGPEIEQLPPKPPLPVPTEPVVDVEPLISAEPSSDEVADDLVADSVADDSAASEPLAGRVGKWSKKRIAITWLASLAAAILVTATVTGFVSRRIQADPREIAVLGVDAFAEWPEFFGNFTEDGEREPGLPEGAMAFQSFHGLAPFRMPNGGFADGRDQTCLAVVDLAAVDNDSSSFSGAYFGGCAAGAFAATAEIVIASGQSLPDELLEAFPEGTALQFVLEGDEVVVLSDED